jgi:peroxiredoxin
MRKLTFCTLQVLLLTLSCHVSAAVRVGQPAPDFSLKDSNGATRALSDYRGKLVVLEWTNHDCPFVRKHYGAGNMQAQQKEAIKKGVVWLSVISSAPGKQGYVSGQQANKLTVERGAAPTAVLLDPDGRVGQLYGAKTTPHMYIVDTGGTLRYMGGIDSIPTADKDDIPDATQFVRVALDELLDGKAVTTTVSRPYGCSVKY